MNTAEQPAVQFDQYRRNYNDVATWLAETLDGSMMTPFEYTFDGHELYAEDGSAMGDIFLNAKRDAVQLAARDPRLSFELRRRNIEFNGEYGDMIKMARGEQPNTKVILSDFPPELMHASESIGGYNVKRKQTMLRVLAWDGQKLTMYSQSLDGSNREALEAIYHKFGVRPQPGELLGQRIGLHCNQTEQAYLTSQLTGVYDRSLAEQYGGQWYAGREDERRDTYQFVLSQQDLLDHFAVRFMHRQPTDTDRYNIAALMEQRFEQFKAPDITYSTAEIVFASMRPHDLDWQLTKAGDAARANGKTYDGCGMSIGSDGSLDGLLQAAGYGNQSRDTSDKFGSLSFTCTKGHYNTRPYGRLISNCRQCGQDVSCKEPAKLKQKPKERLTFKTLLGIETDYTEKKLPKPIPVTENIGQEVLASV